MTVRRQLKSGTPPELIEPDAQQGFTLSEPQMSTSTGRPAVGRPAISDYLRNYSLGMTLVAVVVCLANYATAAPGQPAGGRLNLLCLVIYLAAVACSAARIMRGSQWRFLAWSW